MPADPIRLTLPLNLEEAKELRAGQACLLSGPLFTLRDAGHQRLLAEMGESKELPYGLTGQTIFYAGPTPSAAGRPFGCHWPHAHLLREWTSRLPVLWIVASPQQWAKAIVPKRFAKPA